MSKGLYAKHIKEYNSWRAMIARCNNPNNNRYERYGGRGIKVCDYWMKFDNFFYDMGEKPSPKHSINRINNDEGYYKENCEWSLDHLQANNKTTNIFVEHEGKNMTISEWANYLGIPYSTLHARLRIHCWDVDRAFYTPCQATSKRSKNKFKPGDFDTALRLIHDLLYEYNDLCINSAKQFIKRFM